MSGAVERDRAHDALWDARNRVVVHAQILLAAADEQGGNVLPRHLAELRKLLADEDAANEAWRALVVHRA